MKMNTIHPYGKTLLLVIDGMEDITYPELAEQTPFQYARCVNFDHMGMDKTCFTPKGWAADSLACILTMLGVQPQHIPMGRAYVEALAHGVPCGGEDLLLRVNRVEIRNGKLVSPCIHTTGKTAKAYPVDLGIPCCLYHTGGYRGLLILAKAKRFGQSIKVLPPHECIGRAVGEIGPKGSGLGEKLRGWMLGQLKATKPYTYYPWSPSVPCSLPSFEAIQGRKGAVVCQKDVVRGIARLLQMDCYVEPSFTGDVDTDLVKKGQLGLKLLQDYPFVMIHVNGADEAAHRRNPKEKARFIRRIDRDLLGLLKQKAEENVRLVITSDHRSICKTGCHSSGSVTRWTGNIK